MGQLAGKADIYVAGVWALTSQEGSSIDGIAGVENSLVFDSSGNLAGYTSKPVPCVIKANFIVGPDFQISDWTTSGVSVVFACDNGVTFQIANGTFLKTETLDANKGLIAISYGGKGVQI